ncbi:MAG TPA: phosphoglycerate dehydrogenase [Gammaproteobacteria bacterium]|jgi:D-3-phosphoglycerate dehydrogenase|nr:phosphoglycerate dehydrogenase [Gammaproteobacteria bacterium]
MATFKIQTLNSIAVAGLNRLPRDRYEVASEISRPDAILLRSFKMHDMQIPDSVLAVGRAGAGTNNIPVAKLGKLGIPVFNTPGANANAVKELVLAGLLMAARNLPQALDFVRDLKSSGEELDKAVEAGKKNFVGFELPKRTLGVVGLGAIGVEVANAALRLGMNVLGYDPTITVQAAWQLSSGVQKAVNLDDLFARADVVTVHVPLNKATDKLVNATRLEAMRRGGVILNFSREAIVDSAAVMDALNSGKLRGYVTDFPTRALIDHPRVICLPHLGASTVEAEENCAVMVVDDVREYLENGNITRSVNFPETVLHRTRQHRIAIPHRNVPNMVAQILTALAAQNINIADMLNRSRDELSYTIVDLDAPPNDATLARIRGIDGILSVRVLPIIEA